MTEKVGDIPKYVKIGTRKYEIIPDDVVSAEGIGGDVVYRWNRLRVNPDLPRDEAKGTILHEIVHVILWRMGHEATNDENFVVALSQWLYEIIIENPELVEWLKK